MGKFKTKSRSGKAKGLIRAIAYIFLFYLVAKFVYPIVVSFAQIKLTTTRDNVILLTPQHENFMNMFDGNLQTTWFPGWGTNYPASTLIDLKGTFTITKIRFQNYTGSRAFKVYAGPDPFTMTTIVDQVITGYKQWTDINLNITGALYLKFELPDSKTESPAEVEIYATKTADPVDTSGAGVFRAPKNVNGIMGVNGFHWVLADIETPFFMIREYLDIEWIQKEDGKYRYNPSAAGAGMFDDHYAEMKNKGYEVMPCLQGNLPWTRSSTYADKDFKPIYPLTASPSEPASYIKQAEFHFQFTARYGYTKVPDSLLKIDGTPRWTADPVNVKKSGLGLVRYFECWNEPDKNWKGAEGNFSPYEYAAYISAVADGHCNTLGKNLGIKNADPGAKIVMAGLTTMDLDYVKVMVLWFKKYRPDHKVPIDVFNFHHYANTSGLQYQTSSTGVSPEQDKVRERLAKIKNYVDTNLPGKEIFFSEFGYDSNTGSVQRCEPIGSMNRTEVQAIWNVRTMLDAMAAQIDRSYAYMMYDESPDENNSAVFGNCGMVSGGYDLNSTKKPSWYYIKTMKEILRDYTFMADESTDTIVRKYKFKKQNTIVYALWLTSSVDAKTTFKLDLPVLNNVTLVSLEDKNEMGNRTTLSAAKSFAIPISERPVLVIADELPTATFRNH